METESDFKEDECDGFVWKVEIPEDGGDEPEESFFEMEQFLDDIFQTLDTISTQNLQKAPKIVKGWIIRMSSETEVEHFPTPYFEAVIAYLFKPNTKGIRRLFTLELLKVITQHSTVPSEIFSDHEVFEHIKSFISIPLDQEGLNAFAILANILVDLPFMFDKAQIDLQWVLELFEWQEGSNETLFEQFASYASSLVYSFIHHCKGPSQVEMAWAVLEMALCYSSGLWRKYPLQGMLLLLRTNWISQREEFLDQVGDVLLVRPVESEVLELVCHIAKYAYKHLLSRESFTVRLFLDAIDGTKDDQSIQEVISTITKMGKIDQGCYESFVIYDGFKKGYNWMCHGSFKTQDCTISILVSIFKTNPMLCLQQCEDDDLLSAIMIKMLSIDSESSFYDRLDSICAVLARSKTSNTHPDLIPMFTSKFDPQILERACDRDERMLELSAFVMNLIG